MCTGRYVVDEGGGRLLPAHTQHIGSSVCSFEKLALVSFELYIFTRLCAHGTAGRTYRNRE